MECEWEPSQRERNLVKHKLDLARAPELFDGRPMVRYDLLRNDEPLLASTMIMDGNFVVVIWRMRGGVIRLISLRRARDAEIRSFRAWHG